MILDRFKECIGIFRTVEARFKISGGESFVAGVSCVLMDATDAVEFIWTARSGRPVAVHRCVLVVLSETTFGARSCGRKSKYARCYVSMLEKRKSESADLRCIVSSQDCPEAGGT